MNEFTVAVQTSPTGGRDEQLSVTGFIPLLQPEQGAAEKKISWYMLNLSTTSVSFKTGK